MVVALPVQGSAPSADNSDQSLLKRFHSGDQEAATALYRRYAARVQALVKAQCSPELAKCLEPADLVQSVFGAFFQKAGDGYYAVPAGEDLWGLLLVITLILYRMVRQMFVINVVNQIIMHDIVPKVVHHLMVLHHKLN